MTSIASAPAGAGLGPDGDGGGLGGHHQGAAGIEAFVMFMRHELRTPINGILGYSQLLLEEADDLRIGESAREDLRRIEASGRELLRLVGEIVTPASRAAADIDLCAANLRHALRTPITSVLGYAELLLEEGEGAPWEDDLRKIHVSAGRLLGLLAQIEQLYRLRAVGEPAAANARPAGEAVPLEARGVAATLRADDAGAVIASGGAILVVDDQEENRDVLARRLGRQGHEVLLAASGEEALALLSARPCDVILLDLLMPGLNGFEVLTRLKRDEHLREIPVLVITAIDDQASVVRCIGMGADDYLPKPFDPLLLRARVSACLAKKRARDLEIEYLRSVARVTSAATALEAGSYAPDTLDEIARRADALGNLARVFQRMAREVQTRERALKQQVHQLQIEIDQRKKEAQVAEITETDYFRQLQERARTLHQRVRGHRDGA